MSNDVESVLKALSWYAAKILHQIDKISFIEIERNYIQIEILYHSVYLFCKTKAYKRSKYVYCGGCIECCSNYLFALKK